MDDTASLPDELVQCAAPSITPEEARTMQQWAGMSGAVAWHLIERHADSWGDVELMMQAWRSANAGTPVA